MHSAYKLLRKFNKVFTGPLKDDMPLYSAHCTVLLVLQLNLNQKLLFFVIK